VDKINYYLKISQKSMVNFIPLTQYIVCYILLVFIFDSIYQNICDAQHWNTFFLSNIKILALNAFISWVLWLFAVKFRTVFLSFVLQFFSIAKPQCGRLELHVQNSNSSLHSSSSCGTNSNSFFIAWTQFSKLYTLIPWL